MRVLVCVHMRDVDARGLQLANLRARLSFDLARIEAPRQSTRGERFQALAEADSAGMLRSRSNGRQSFLIKNRLAIDQYDMTAYAETRNGLCQTHGIFEGASVGHERGGSNDAACVSFNNGAIDACGETKVIGIDN